MASLPPPGTSNPARREAAPARRHFRVCRPRCSKQTVPPPPPRDSAAGPGFPGGASHSARPVEGNFLRSAGRRPRPDAAGGQDLAGGSAGGRWADRKRGDTRGPEVALLGESGRRWRRSGGVLERGGPWRKKAGPRVPNPEEQVAVVSLGKWRAWEEELGFSGQDSKAVGWRSGGGGSERRPELHLLGAGKGGYGKRKRRTGEGVRLKEMRFVNEPWRPFISVKTGVGVTKLVLRGPRKPWRALGCSLTRDFRKGAEIPEEEGNETLTNRYTVKRNSR